VQEGADEGPCVRVMRYRAFRQCRSIRLHLQDLRFAGKRESSYGMLPALIGSAQSVRAYECFYRGAWCCGQGTLNQV
jgi:hypothetical protein